MTLGRRSVLREGGWTVLRPQHSCDGCKFRLSWNELRCPRCGEHCADRLLRDITLYLEFVEISPGLDARTTELKPPTTEPPAGG